MAKYYGVERSEEYLAHYGVRGMKWGIRRAIARGDSGALRKHYMKAAKKLSKLSINANKDLMKRRYNTAKSNMLQGAAASGVMSAGLTAALNAKNGHSFKNAALYGLGAGAVGATAGALLNSKGIMSGRYASDRGHEKAVAKRNQWRRDMESAFKGTQYGGEEQRKFHQKITALSDAKNPADYAYKQYKKASKRANNVKTFDNLSSSQKRQVANGLSKLADRFEGHYQKGLSKGMSHEQAERYANQKLNAPKKKRK